MRRPYRWLSCDRSVSMNLRTLSGCRAYLGQHVFASPPSLASGWTDRWVSFEAVVLPRILYAVSVDMRAASPLAFRPHRS